MSTIAENIAAIRARIDAAARLSGRTGADITLVAATKMNDAARVREAVAAGIDACGENRVQEMTEKLAEGAYTGAPLHFIGHLQTNKVRALIGRTALIESVDSERLLALIDRESEARGVVTRVLMQAHVAAEETKTGFLPDELLDYFAARRYESLRSTHICGIMGMATNTDDRARIEADFAALAGLKARITAMCPDLRGFDTLSMGMSDDYPLAVEHGATLVRVGTAIFGERDYSPTAAQ